MANRLEPIEVLSKIISVGVDKFTKVNSDSFGALSVETYKCSEDNDEYEITVGSGGKILGIKSMYSNFSATEVEYLLKPRAVPPTYVAPPAMAPVAVPPPPTMPNPVPVVAALNTQPYADALANYVKLNPNIIISCFDPSLASTINEADAAVATAYVFEGYEVNKQTSTIYFSAGACADKTIAAHLRASMLFDSVTGVITDINFW